MCKHIHSITWLSHTVLATNICCCCCCWMGNSNCCACAHEMDTQCWQGFCCSFSCVCNDWMNKLKKKNKSTLCTLYARVTLDYWFHRESSHNHIYVNTFTHLQAQNKHWPIFFLHSYDWWSGGVGNAFLPLLLSKIIINPMNEFDVVVDIDSHSRFCVCLARPTITNNHHHQ